MFLSKPMKKLAPKAIQILAILFGIAISQETAAAVAGSSARSDIPHYGKSISPIPRPSIDSVSCGQLNKRLTESAPQAVQTDAPDIELARTFSIYLRSIGADLGASVIEAVPDEFVWWLQVMGPVSALSLGVAVHESSHALDRYLLVCGNGTARFKIGGKTFSTDLLPSQTPSISELILGPNPIELSLLTPLRREAYVVRATSGNDLITLLSEVSAYLLDAHTEMALYERVLAGYSLFPASITYRNAGFSGLIDMLVLLKIYLRQLEISSATQLIDVSQKREIGCFIMIAHGFAKSLVNYALDRRITQRLGFSIGAERARALEFAELTEVDGGPGFSYGHLTRNLAHQPRC